ncbi:MAG: aconitase X catalytic domain-containing protein [Thermomicrobiales bacterium]
MTHRSRTHPLTGIDPSLRLSNEERGMLAGEAGEAVRQAMRILCRVAPAYGATALLPITRAHIDGCIYEGEAGLAFAERLAAAGGRVRVPTSLNVISLDRQHWRQHGLPAGYADGAARLGQAYVNMGATPAFTCAPYQTAARPAFGEQVAWAESNAVAFANAIIGARTNRYGDYLDAACALTGRAPAAGLHLDGPRLATVLVDLGGISAELMADETFWPVLGYHLGGLVDDEVAAVVGLGETPGEDALKALAAAAATSGSVAMFHLVGITPEAATLAEATGDRPARRTVRVGLADLRATRDSLDSAAPRDGLGLVAFGSPHCSLAECRRLAALMAGRRAAAGIEVWVTTSRAVRDLLGRGGELATLEAFGATVTADTCIVVSPLVRQRGMTMMTNSAKYAHYGPGITGNRASFASTADCVASAEAGRVIREDGPWGG